MKTLLFITLLSAMTYAGKAPTPEACCWYDMKNFVCWKGELHGELTPYCFGHYMSGEKTRTNSQKKGLCDLSTESTDKDLYGYQSCKDKEEILKKHNPGD